MVAEILKLRLHERGRRRGNFLEIDIDIDAVDEALPNGQSVGGGEGASR